MRIFTLHDIAGSDRGGGAFDELLHFATMDHQHFTSTATSQVASTALIESID
jgi:hypothetical protein